MQIFYGIVDVLEPVHAAGIYISLCLPLTCLP